KKKIVYICIIRVILFLLNFLNRKKENTMTALLQKQIEYYDKDVLLEGFCVYPEKQTSPAVLIVHDWSGRNEFAMNKAKKIAELGYVGFALDMYGKGKIGK